MANKQFTKDELGKMTIAQLAQLAGGNEHGTSRDGSAPTEISAMNPTMKRNHLISALAFLLMLAVAGGILALLIGGATQ